MIRPLFAIAAALLAHPAAAQQAPSPPGFTMPATHQFEIQSEGGETYRIFVSYPDTGEPPEGGYPVLYVLDGNAYFASFAEARRVQQWSDAGKGIVVGVGYPGDDAYSPRRIKDYIPKLPDPLPANYKKLAKYPSGQRAAFLEFLTGKLRNEIGKRYKVDQTRQSLFGHSFGGMFGLYALYNAPGAFHSIIVASPSLEWAGQQILPEERAFAAKLTSGKIGATPRIMVAVGDRDVDDDPMPAHQLVARWEALSAYGLRTRLVRYAEEGHMTVPSRSVPDVLRFVFAQK